MPGANVKLGGLISSEDKQVNSIAIALTLMSYKVLAIYGMLEKPNNFQNLNC